MTPRQTAVPRQWLVTDERIGEALWPAVRRLPRGSGILFRHYSLSSGERQRMLARLRRTARARGLVVIDEAVGAAARVHDAKELRQARLSGSRLIFLSPVYPTRSHPEWTALPRMRAAALARLAGRRAIALGGMTARRFSRVKRLGFVGWAGIDAWTKA